MKTFAKAILSLLGGVIIGVAVFKGPWGIFVAVLTIAILHEVLTK